MTDAALPRFFRVRQKFPSMAIDDVPAAVREAIGTSSLRRHVSPGQTVAVCVGSRGIANLAAVVATTAGEIRSLGARPIVVPAMGSHGGATAAGQAAVLARYGVDPTSLECPVDASMETIVVGRLAGGTPIHFARSAHDVDHVVVINRVKPHTRLIGDLESGICKMLLIGLGKRDGAEVYHREFPQVDYRFDEIARQVVPILLRDTPLRLGIALVEDAYEQTSHVEAIEAADMLDREPELLRMARDRMPRLPFDRADLVIIDQIGKEISGSGLDTNVVGRKSNDKAAAADEFPKVRHLYVRGLTEKSAGNATGIGIAEFCHSRLLRQMDAEITRINCLTGNHVTAAAIPVDYPSDREALQVCLTQRLCADPADVRWIRIRDTLHLNQVACSEAYRDEADARDDLECRDEPAPLAFDGEGDLVDESL